MPECLAEMVSALHDHDGDARLAPFRRLPAPFAALVVQTGEPCRWRRAGSGAWRRSPRVALHAVATCWSEALEPGGDRSLYVMALLEPGAPASLFGLALRDGEIVDMEQVRPAWASRLLGSMRQIRSPEARLSLLADALAGLGAVPPEPDIRHFVGQARASAGALRISEAAAELAVGQRQLRDRFREQVGLGPKSWCRIERFAARLKDLHPAPWATTAPCGPDFFDQAHEIREFRAMAGITPAAYRREKALGDRRLFAFG